MNLHALSESVRTKIGIYGLGRVGTSLAHHFSEAQNTVVAFGREVEKTQKIARKLHISVGTTSSFDELRCLFLCVSDDSLPTVSVQIAAQCASFAGCLVIHTSGLLTSEVLSAFEEKGGTVLSFHPLQTFSSQETPAVLEDIYIGLEGKEEAIREGIELVKLLKAKYLVLPTEAKVRYHLAASIASNYFVTLSALSHEVLHSIGIPPEVAPELLKPLIAGTWQNLQHQTPEMALTGAIVRGDVETIKEHLNTLQMRLPHLKPVYSALAMETVRLAVRSQRLTPQQAHSILDLL